ncbi:hypothetical protein QBC35DRAFT_408084 [Podospora australis]|uniref:Zn(2)-C6 fungal-type domain-containing protein n=1 Tax=Podospora australis TaxID=1536484 RepID=A0AAN6WUV2_9PEZI|nr:hypothetical protein QBC35DRAFT_408084 [Podospora australis]
MLRRSHRKSRQGCIQCKRRHVKCDEGRPACSLCTLSDRTCSFISDPPSDPLPLPRRAKPASHSGSSTVTSSISNSPSSHVHFSGSPSPAVTQPATSPPPTSALPMPSPNGSLNLTHTHLLIHLLSTHDLFDRSTPPEEYHPRILQGLQIADSGPYPYLTHALLAFSARHLAFLHPSNPIYPLEAVTLQTEAISLFNQTFQPFTPENSKDAVAIVLFSSILGHHLLADTLSSLSSLCSSPSSPGHDRPSPDTNKFDKFLQAWINCDNIHKGLKTVTVAAWPRLMASPMADILSSSRGFTSRDPKGNHCDSLLAMIDSSKTLGQEEQKEICQKVVRYLQIGVDAVLEEEQEPDHQHPLSNRHRMIFAWLLMVPSEFTSLLQTKQPESLVLLGHYALLLHYGRQMWQIGDAGKHVLELVLDNLAADWHRWLEWPRSVIYGEKDQAEMNPSR